MVHLWLVGKHLVDFLLMLIELFSQLSRLRRWRYERILIEVVVFEGGWVTLSTNFRGKGGRSPTPLGVRQLQSLGYHVVLFQRVCMILRLAVLIQYRRVTDRHTDRQTHDDG